MAERKRAAVNGSGRLRPVDARIVSAHNDGNPHFAGEAVAVTEAVAQGL
jgi:hypothetical protein